MLIAVCLALAALSLLLPSAPTTDSWGWIVWGREVAHLDLNTDVGGSPAWKPLPVLFTLVFSLLGDAAPELWLWIARAGSLLAVVAAFRLASRLAGAWAGAVAAAALPLAGTWLRGAAHGYSEGLLSAALLFALERHLDGRRLSAWGLLLVAALARPEAFALCCAYTVYAWRREAYDLRLAATALGLVPLLWLGADWWGSGDPLHGAEVARSVDANLAWHDLLAAGAGGAGAPVLVLSGFACLTGCRERDARVLAVSGCVLAWTALVCVVVALGGPGAPRFLAPAVAGICVLGGVGAARVVQAAGEVPIRRLALAALLVLASASAAVPLAATSAGQLARAERRALVEAALRALVRGAERQLKPCGTYAVPADLGWLEGAVAWELGVPLARVHSLRRSESVAAALTRYGKVLVVDQEHRDEPLMSRGSRRAGVRAYRLPDFLPCVALFSLRQARPQVIGGKRSAQIRMVRRAEQWRAWTIRASRRTSHPLIRRAASSPAGGSVPRPCSNLPRRSPKHDSDRADPAFRQFPGSRRHIVRLHGTGLDRLSGLPGRAGVANARLESGLAAAMSRLRSSRRAAGP